MPIIKNGPMLKYHQFRMLIEGDIRNGRYALGTALPSEVRLAEIYGLCRQTVRKALKELEEEGYLLREKGRGTFVARVGERSENTPVNIGVIIYKPALEAQWFLPELLRGIADAADGDPGSIVIIPFDEDTPGVREGAFCKRVMSQRNLHGIIIIGEELHDNEIFYLLTRKYPLVLLRLAAYAGVAADYVTYDHEQVIQKTISYLAGMGHCRIAYMGGLYSRYYSAFYSRSAFCNIMEAHGFPVPAEHIVECDYRGKSTFKLATEILAGPDMPTAIILADDSFAPEVYRAAADRGLKIADDLAVIGCNDLPIANIITPALTTIRVPRFRIGHRACEIVRERITSHGGEGTSGIRLEMDVDLVERDSCRPPG